MVTAIAAVGGLKNTIRMLPGTYAVDVAFNATVVTTVVATGATLVGSTATGPLLTTSSNTNLSLRDLAIHAPGIRRAVQCVGGGAASMLALTGSEIVGPISIDNCHLALSRANVGTVEVNNLSPITIDRSTVQGLSLVFGKAAIATVTNSVLLFVDLPRFSPYSVSGRISFSTISASYVDCEANNGFGAVGFLFDNDIIVGMNGPSSVLSGNASCFDHDIATPQAVPLGTNVQITDPHFVDPTHSDFHLMGNSPAIDAADPAATDAIDYDGVARPQGAGRDLGAFEYH